MKKQEKEKPISIASYLEGLKLHDPEGDTLLDLLDPDGSTIVTYSEDVRFLDKGQLDWIEIHMPLEWAALLNEKSGGRMVHSELKRPKPEDSFGDRNIAQMIIKVEFPGKMFSVKSRRMTRIMSSGMKKDMAMRIGKEFMPPFEVHQNTCLYPAGYVDSFWAWVYKDEMTPSKRESFIEVGSQFIKEADGEFVDLKPRANDDCVSCLRVKWTRDVSPQERKKLAGMLSRAALSIFGSNHFVNERI